jgi:peroxiredoxin
VIRAKRNAHVFHIHVNPFELILARAKDGTITKSEWRDTIFVDDGKEVTIRTRFQDFPGTTVLHCHILDHEDQGMMRLVEILDGKAAAPGGAGARLKEASAPVPRLCLPDARGNTHDLSRLKDRLVVVVFFRGLQCAHCTALLRSLVHAVGQPGSPNAMILAVSSEPIEDPGQALKGLGGGMPFSLLVDERLQAFKDFGCFDGSPQHGLFLIDRNGTIRSQYVGDAPFADMKVLAERLRRLSRAGSKPG